MRGFVVIPSHSRNRPAHPFNFTLESHSELPELFKFINECSTGFFEHSEFTFKVGFHLFLLLLELS